MWVWNLESHRRGNYKQCGRFEIFELKNDEENGIVSEKLSCLPIRHKDLMMVKYSATSS